MRSIGGPFTPEPLRTRKDHIGGQDFNKHADGERTFRLHHTHSCGFEGEAEHWQCVSFENWTCPQCGEVTHVWDENDALRDGADLDVPHEDPDWLDGPPESLEDRGVA